MTGNSKPIFAVQNIVATARLADSFDIPRLMAFDPFRGLAKKGRQPWIGFRFGPSNRYVAIYPRGNVLVTGCRSLVEASKLLHSVRGLLASVVDLRSEPFQVVVQNIVATLDLKCTLKLEPLAAALSAQNYEYEPEQFPALILRFPDEQGVILIFSSGKLV